MIKFRDPRLGPYLVILGIVLLSAYAGLQHQLYVPPPAAPKPPAPILDGDHSGYDRGGAIKW